MRPDHLNLQVPDLKSSRELTFSTALPPRHDKKTTNSYCTTMSALRKHLKTLLGDKDTCVQLKLVVTPTDRYTETKRTSWLLKTKSVVEGFTVNVTQKC